MTSQVSGGELVTRCLVQEGVKHVFCVPGESYLEVLDAFYDEPGIRLISARHEGGAAFMAEAYAKASGTVGVCMATRAVGLSNLSIGLHTAKQDSTPVVALVGGVPQSHLEREAFQEVPLAKWFEPVCKWTVEVRDATRLPELLHRAFYVAETGRKGPVLVVLPQDVLEALVLQPEPLLTPYRAGVPHPDAQSIQTVHQALIDAKRPMVIVGGGVIQSQAAGLVEELAERYALPVATAFRRFDAIPNSAACFAGWLGFGPHRALAEELHHADLVLCIGTRLSQVTTQDYTLPGRHAKVVFVDVDALAGPASHPPAFTVVSDATQFCKAMLESFTPQELGMSSALREYRKTRVQQLHEAYLHFSQPRRIYDTDYVNLEGLLYDFLKVTPTDTVITNDAGNFFGWLARYYRFEKTGSYVGPTSGAMGYALPAAIGAKLAKDDKTVVAFAGDGGFMMTMAELATAALYHVKIIAVVINNNRFGTIRAHQERKHKGRPVGTDLKNPSFAQICKSFGGFGITVRNNAEFVPAFEGALQADGFAVIEVLADPDILSVSGARV